MPSVFEDFDVVFLLLIALDAYGICMLHLVNKSLYKFVRELPISGSIVSDNWNINVEYKYLATYGSYPSFLYPSFTYTITMGGTMIEQVNAVNRMTNGFTRKLVIDHVVEDGFIMHVEKSAEEFKLLYSLLPNIEELCIHPTANWEVGLEQCTKISKLKCWLYNDDMRRNMKIIKLLHRMTHIKHLDINSCYENIPTSIPRELGWGHLKTLGASLNVRDLQSLLPILTGIKTLNIGILTQHEPKPCTIKFTKIETVNIHSLYPSKSLKINCAGVERLIIDRMRVLTFVGDSKFLGPVNDCGIDIINPTGIHTM
jgi:hypothetical protein